MREQSMRNDGEGNLVTELDLLRAKDNYTFNGDLNNTNAGRQAFTNANGDDFYVTRLRIIENAAAAETVQIFDGTVAAGTKIADIDIVASGDLDIILSKKCTSTNGIYVYSASASDITLLLEVAKDRVSQYKE